MGVPGRAVIGMLFSMSLLVAACGGGDAPQAGGESVPAVGTPAPVVPPAPPAPAVPPATGPARDEVLVETGSSERSAGFTGFFWNPRSVAEIGQSFVVDEPFVLTSVELRPMDVTRIDLDRVAPEEWMALPDDRKGEYEVWVPNEANVQLAVQVNVWRMVDEEDPGERIVVDRLERLLVEDVAVTLDIGQRFGSPPAEFMLSDPIELGVGRHLVSFVLSTDDPGILTVLIGGWHTGENDRRGADEIGPLPPCDYERLPPAYAHGRAYVRTIDVTGDGVEIDVFREHDAKVPDCVVSGRTAMDVFNPGDLAVRLRGRPLS